MPSNTHTQVENHSRMVWYRAFDETTEIEVVRAHAAAEAAAWNTRKAAGKQPFFVRTFTRKVPIANRKVTIHVAAVFDPNRKPEKRDE